MIIIGYNPFDWTQYLVRAVRKLRQRAGLEPWRPEFFDVSYVWLPYVPQWLQYVA